MSVYFAYGTHFRSSWSLPLPVATASGPIDVEIEEVGDTFFERLTLPLAEKAQEVLWFRHCHLANGSDYLCWNGLFEFLISADGRRVFGRRLSRGTLEFLQTYVMGQVLSIALVRQGMESLHSTVVVVDCEAIAFLGNSGFGKSTLAAAFIHSGYRVLTDDLLVIKKTDRGLMAQPGPARLKLFPEPAEALLAGHSLGVAMNPYTHKLVYALDSDLVVSNATPIKSCYLLEAPGTVVQGKELIMRDLSFREACIGLITNSYNTTISDPDRYARQFDFVTDLATKLVVKSLSYPRDLSKILQVVDGVVRDVRERRISTIIA